MDPNETLRLALEALSAADRAANDWEEAVENGNEEGGGYEEEEENARGRELSALRMLSLHFAVLNNWIRTEGFLPDVWAPPQRVAIAEPYTRAQLRQVMDENGYVTAVIGVDIAELIDASLDAVNERLSEEVTGDVTALMDIGYEVVGHDGAMTVLLEVVGNVEVYLAEGDERGLDTVDYCSVCEAVTGHPTVTQYADERCMCCGRGWGSDEGTCTGKHVEGDVWWQLLDEEQGNGEGI